MKIELFKRTPQTVFSKRKPKQLLETKFFKTNSQNEFP